MKTRSELIREYLQKIKAANKELTKKEHFKDLLHRLYYGENEIEKIIDVISAGAEKTILNIPRKDKMHKGSADTLYNNIIIEFENNLKLTEPHAKEQLAGYLLGQFKSGEGYNFTLIASDFITWKLYAPDIKCLENLETLQEHEVILKEIPSATFILNEHNTEDFYYYLDRFLFKEEKQKATLKRIEEAFGYQSNTFIECYRQLSHVFEDAKKFGEVQVSYEEWKKFLSIAYGSFTDNTNKFIIHTYLSIFAKMLAYEVVSNDDYIDDDETKRILDGSIFNQFNIRNFVDNDFFHWVQRERNFLKLKKVFRLLAQEISTFDFTNVEEDILKGVYQDLIDLDTRHTLGEYYTPDWLCERMVNEFYFKATDKILDPACGSGSFLRAAIHRLRELNNDISPEQISNSVYGIDIHPLSVQITKTTLLLALGKEVSHLRKPVYLNIILANTLLAPEGVKNLFGGEFRMKIDKDSYDLNTQVLADVELFDEALEACESLAEQTLNKKKESVVTFERILKANTKSKGYNQQIVESFYKIYEGLKQVKEKGRDSIWKFIVQNLYKPYFLAEKFDYIIGNPPWFTYKDVKNEEYQRTLDDLGRKYNIVTKQKGTFAHLEIAAIFLVHCTNYFLKSSGKLAFVLPRSFFDGKQHSNTREGKVLGMKIIDIWDLINVKPLFNINSCVIFTKKASAGKAFPKEGLKGLAFRASLPTKSCNYNTAKEFLLEERVSWFYIRQGSSSAFSTNNTKAVTKNNPYKNFFQAGATLRPRVFCFVEIEHGNPLDFKDRILNIKTTDSIQVDAKRPWKDLEFQGRIESNFLFYTALAKSILPFNLHNPSLVVLPIVIENKEGHKKIVLKSVKELIRDGSLNASKWFFNCENIWNIHRTELNKQYTVEDYLNFQNKITTQDLNHRFIVLYNASAKDANSTVVDRDDLNLEFINDHVAYSYYTSNINEAHYLTSILNSSVPNKMMKDFQAKGLFGARHVHKKILDVYFPKFDEKNKAHMQLAALSQTAHNKVTLFLKQNPPKQDLTAIHLGRLRVEIKKFLADELKQIDEIVKGLIG